LFTRKTDLKFTQVADSTNRQTDRRTVYVICLAEDRGA